MCLRNRSPPEYSGSSFAVPPVAKKIRVYYNTEFRNRYGSNAASQSEVFITAASKKFVEVGLQIEICWSSWSSTDFQSTDINDAWSELLGNGYGNCNVRALFSYKDFKGCAIGVGSEPGSTVFVQFRPDACHLWKSPNNNFERIYVLKHELGDNNNAHHDHAWSKWSGAHRHRTIMHGSAWYHYHDVWSDTNANRMRNHLGTMGTSTFDVGTSVSEVL